MDIARCVALGMQPSFGFGDRTGLATPGHVAAMRRCGSGIAPIFPQKDSEFGGSRGFTSTLQADQHNHMRLGAAGACFPLSPSFRCARAQLAS